MSNLFTLGEALAVAQRIELAGEAFYGEALERAVEPETEELFRFLRDQERVHYAVFGEMLRATPEGEKPLDEQTSRFMDAAVRDHTLTTAEAAKGLAAKGDTAALVEVALGFERETIRFFTTVKDVARGIDRNRLERILDEEHRHVERLEAYRKSLGD
jgi:rubrerythrin